VTIRVRHLDCGRMTPLGGALVYGRGAPHRHLVCHCLLLELPDRLVLVDSGFGLADIADPRRRLGRMFVSVVRPRLEPSRTAAAQIEALGYRIDDVRDIVLTHMDVDHVGGLSDFPDARVHVAQAELTHATQRRGFHDRMRYRPIQWAHGPKWYRYRSDGEPWFGFPAVRSLDTLPPEILMMPLCGHSMGHSGIAIDTGGPSGAESADAPPRWLLHCGDAYFHRGDVHPDHDRCPLALRGFQRLVASDNRARLDNQARLAELAAHHGSDVRIFCAHDAEEFERV
jgi:glyoxylase-like metal-dependent hydrolase (beta-lactamase superfamily II)